MYDTEQAPSEYVAYAEKEALIFKGKEMSFELIPQEQIIEKANSSSIYEEISSKKDFSFFEECRRMYSQKIQDWILFIRESGYKVTSYVLASFLGEPIVFFKSSFYYVVGYVNGFGFYGLNPSSITEEDANKRPILLLHGNYHNQSAFLYLGKVLSKKNLGPIYTLNLNSGNLTEKDTVLIQEKIKQIQSAYEIYGKIAKIDIVGHSRGAEMAFCMGIDKKNWLITPDGKIIIDSENFEKNPAIGRIIRLGLSTSNAYREKTEENYLQDIYEIDAFFDLIREKEEISHQAASHKLEIACGHVGLLQSEEALEQVAEWLSY